MNQLATLRNPNPTENLEMLGGLGNIANLMKQAKEMQSRFAEMQDELAAQRYDGDAGAGAVVATVDGKCVLVDIKIQPSAADDVELLEDLIKSAVSVASKKAREAATSHMSQLTGGMNIPGLSEMLGGGS
jgi:nucleoid-associated protein EbfC